MHHVADQHRKVAVVCNLRDSGLRIGKSRYVFLMKSLVIAAKALADPSRVRLLMALRAGELCVCELCDALNLSQSTLSTHLQVLRSAGMVTTRRDGKWSYYALAKGGSELLKLLCLHFASSMDSNSTLRTDARRLKSRLQLRQAGECCVGFVCSKTQKEEVIL